MNELRLALRRLMSSPGFTLTAVLSLSLGIGANTAVFSALNAVLLKPLPVSDPGRLVFLHREGAFPTYSYPAYRDLRDRQQSLSDLAAYRFAPISLNTGNGKENARAWSYLVSGNYFPMLGIAAYLGRALTPEDDVRPGGHPVVVLSYGGWQRRFGGDPRAVGKSVRINGQSYSVVGVMPKGFQGTEVFFSPDLFVPMQMQRAVEQYEGLSYRPMSNFFLIGRLKPGVTQAQASADLNAIARRLTEEHLTTDLSMGMALTRPGMMGNLFRGPAASFGAVMLAATGLVLLLACVNLGGLLLARATDRERETAVRLALGASRWQLVRQLFAESLVLSLAGGLGALLMAMWVLDLVMEARPKVDFSIAVLSGMDWRAFAFTLMVAFAASLLFGLLPARSAIRVDLVPALKSEATWRQNVKGWGVRDILVSLQVALSVVLVAATCLIVVSLRNATSVDVGFRPEGLYTLAVDLGLEGYTKEQQSAFRRALVDRARAHPGLAAATVGSHLPLGPQRSYTIIRMEGRVLPKGQRDPAALEYAAGTGYFRTLGTDILQGRDFEDRDRQSPQPLAIVNQTFARTIAGGGQVVGKRFRGNSDGEWTEIVGVVRDGKYLSLGEGPSPAVFSLAGRAHATMLARSRMDKEKTLREMRKLVAGLDPGLTVFDAQSMTDHLGWAMYLVRVSAGLLSAIGVLAMMLAAVGIYGVVAYSVVRRTREVGIRMAIGATPLDVIRLFAGRNGVMVGAGLALGVPAAALLARYAGPVLYGVDPRDPWIYLAAVALVLVVAALAAWQPMWRAIRLNPVTALRQE